MDLSKTTLHFLDEDLAEKLSKFLVQRVIDATNTKEEDAGVPLIALKKSILEVLCIFVYCLSLIGA